MMPPETPCFLNSSASSKPTSSSATWSPSSHASFKKMWNGLELTKEQFKRLFNRAFSYRFHAMMQTILQDSVARGIREAINVILDGEDREVVEAVAMLDKEIRPELPAEQKMLLGTVGTQGVDNKSAFRLLTFWRVVLR